MGRQNSLFQCASPSHDDEFRQFRHPASGRPPGNRRRRVLRDRAQAVRSDQTGRRGVQGMVVAKLSRPGLRLARATPPWPHVSGPRSQPPPTGGVPAVHLSASLELPAQTRKLLAADEASHESVHARDVEVAMKTPVPRDPVVTRWPSSRRYRWRRCRGRRQDGRRCRRWACWLSRRCARHGGTPKV